MKILVCTNLYKDKDLSVTNGIIEYLSHKNVEVSGLVLQSRDTSITEADVIGIDVAIVLGGDGTMMRVAKKLCGYSIPLLGINIGHLGFLAQTGTEGITEVLDRLVSGDYILENRIMLKGKVSRKDTVLFESEALNDICINRGGKLQILSFDIYVNNMFLKSYSADGLIVSTPTGSTGYNLSAGGPIVEPGADMLLLTPIAAHTFMNRSILLKSSDEITIEIGEAHDEELGQEVIANFDGQGSLKLEKGDRIVIGKASNCVSFVQMNNVNFLETLNRKLKED